MRWALMDVAGAWAGLCVSLCLVGVRALAATQVLAPSDDTFINSGYPLNNNGGSSSIFTGIDGTVTWASADMNVDVQRWIDAPSNNHGWRISSSTEGLAFPSAQRFYSSESGLSAPNLAISYVCKTGFLALGNDCTTCTEAA